MPRGPGFNSRRLHPDGNRQAVPGTVPGAARPAVNGGSRPTHGVVNVVAERLELHGVQPAGRSAVRATVLANGEDAPQAQVAPGFKTFPPEAGNNRRAERCGGSLEYVPSSSSRGASRPPAVHPGNVASYGSHRSGSKVWSREDEAPNLPKPDAGGGSASQ